MRPAIASFASLFVLVAAACARPEQATPVDSVTPAPPTAAAPASITTITDRDWALASLGEQTNPMGNGDRPPTLRLESSSLRASGFAGCNRFSGPYTLSGDSLSFGALVSTKMACAQGNEVEVSYLAALGQVKTFTATDSVLTLRSADAPLATLRAQ